MPPPIKFKQGWENENLARYILSRFSFIAQPSTISDDIGTDYFCTLFEVQKSGKHEYPQPRNSFAIQIKSNNSVLDVSNKTNYIGKLEIPYFVGVLDAKQMSLTLYSGEFLPMFFTWKEDRNDPIRVLKLRLCDRQTFDYSSTAFYFQDLGNRNFVLSLPRIAEIHVDADRTTLNKLTDILNRYCSTMQKNIASKISCEYIYEHIDAPPNASIHIQAGSGSYKHFRENFYKRLAEVFYNLEWIYNNYQSDFDLDEFKMYETLFYQLTQERNQVPPWLIERYEALKNSLGVKK